MSQVRLGHTLYRFALSGALALVALGGCNQGDTDGGQGNDSLGIGDHPVSDGGFGAKLSIDIVEEPIPVGERVGFFVTAVDPSGLPLAFRRVFCDSEKGIAILEPSNGGVAFEHTGPDGRMSGTLGGVHKGSYIMECRLEEGFNLVARKSTKVVGEVPPGFTGFPGAAGGNLGGGLIVDDPNNNDDRILSVTFNGTGLTNDPNGPIDITRSFNCDNDATPNENAADIEPFSFDEFTVTVQNDRSEPVTITSVGFSLVQAGVTVDAPNQGTNTVIPAGGTGTIVGSFTQGSGSGKIYAGTAVTLVDGTVPVTFTVEGATTSGSESFSLQATVNVLQGNVDNCGG